MLRQLPPTITADATPDWLPVGWIVHSSVLKRGRQTRTYTQLSTGKKLSTKDQVLEYYKMEKIQEERLIKRGKATLKAFQDIETASERPVGINREFRIGSLAGNPNTENAMESEDSSGEEYEVGCNEITYEIEEDEEDFSEHEYVKNVLWPKPERRDEVLVESEDKAREMPGLPGSFSIEINLNCEPGGDNLVDKDWKKSGIKGIGTGNIEIIDLESDSSEAPEVTQKSGHTSEEPLKAQAAQDELANGWRKTVFFPNREAPKHSVFALGDSNAISSVVDLNNTIELGSNPQAKNIGCSKKRKKNIKTRSSKNTKKKGIDAPTEKVQKGKTPPSKPQGKKGSSSTVMDKKPNDWPELCPHYPFEPLTRSLQLEDDDSVIRNYLEQHFTAASGNADSNLPLPDFGLPSFSNIKFSLKDETESKNKKTTDPPPCVQVASSSLPSCSSMGTSMLQTVAGN